MKHLSQEDYKSFAERQVAGYGSSIQSSGIGAEQFNDQ